MSTTPTAAPSRAKRKAPALPIPEAAAVTMPILPSSRMVSLPSGCPHSYLPTRGRVRMGSGRDVFAIVERVKHCAVGLADDMSLDLQGRRHLTVGNRKGFRRYREMPHTLDR